MTAKGLFWIFVGPALWTAVLLLIAKDTAEGVMQIDRGHAELALRRVVDVPEPGLRIDALTAPIVQQTCLATHSPRPASSPGR